MLSLLTIWSSRTTTSKGVQEEEGLAVVVPVTPGTESNAQEVVGQREDGLEVTGVEVEAKGSNEEAPNSPPEAMEAEKEQPHVPDATPIPPPVQQKRFSFRSVALFNGHRPTSQKQKTIITEEQEERELDKAVDAGKRATRSVRKLRSDREVKKSALALQQMIVGSEKTGISPVGGAKSKPVTRSELKKIKTQLMSPKSANKVIAVLRDLPMPQDSVATNNDSSKSESIGAGGPIHAVCLEVCDADADKEHFSKLKTDSFLDAIPSFANATFDSIIPLFNNLHIVSLISAPDLGLGKTADEDGILAGAVPSAEAVIDGAVQITPQLMALGYATGKAVVPDHKGVYPPLDRMSVFTYWWGLELCIPEPSMKNLANGNNITHTIMNLLTALSLINGGVAEVLPFIRYISQFVDFEWNAIKAQDKGKGVVCAATWIMPAAMVPRPWDFPAPPAPTNKDAKAVKKTEGGDEGVGHGTPSSTPAMPTVPSQGRNQDLVDNISIPPAILPSLVVSAPTAEGEAIESK